MTEHNNETETEIEVVQDEQDFTDELFDEALDCERGALVTRCMR